MRSCGLIRQRKLHSDHCHVLILDPDLLIRCVFCRQRKIKCDRSKPDCTNCAKSGMQCWYLAGQRKPGLRAGYVSALERRLASVEHQINDLKSSKQDQPGPASAQGAQELQSFQSSPASTSCPNGIHHLELSRCEQLLAESTVCSLESRKDLCTQWFEKYHPWFPILHRIAFSEELSKPCLFCSPQLIVFKAILAVIGSSWGVPESKHPIAKQFDEMLRKEIILDAIDGSSLRSLQALLILTIMDYGNGKLSHVWNLLSVCKRKSTGLGLRDLAANKGDNFNEPSTIPPRMLPKPASLIEREDSIRAYWITEALDSSSTVGAAWNLGVLKPENMEWIRCREDIWTSPESIDASSLAKARFSATFSLYVGLVCNEIYLVHHFLQTSFDLSVESERKRWRAEAMALEKKLENWQTQRWNQDFLTSPNVDQESPYIAISIVIACTFQMYDEFVSVAKISSDIRKGQKLHCISDWRTRQLRNAAALRHHGLMQSSAVWMHAVTYHATFDC